MCRRYVVYESRSRSIIISLRGQPYRILEVVMTIVLPKKHRKVISHTENFILFAIGLEGEQKDNVTTTTSAQDLSIQQKHI